MIEFSVRLGAPPGPAFDRFTTRISEWWPPMHRPSGDADSTITISLDGTFSERTADGREFELGRVRTWIRPVRLELDFFLGTGPERPTDVTVTFEPDGKGTRVTVRHRPLESSADLWASRVAKYQSAWPAVLNALEQHGQRI